MSEFIGDVMGPFNNSPHKAASVHCTPGRVELTLLTVTPSGQPWIMRDLNPIAARSLAALLVRASEEAERMRSDPDGLAPGPLPLRGHVEFASPSKLPFQCPFCGSKSLIWDTTADGSKTILCVACNANGDWNKNAPDRVGCADPVPGKLGGAANYRVGCAECGNDYAEGYCPHRLAPPNQQGGVGFTEWGVRVLAPLNKEVRRLRTSGAPAAGLRAALLELANALNEEI